jgi:hypothetical protein
MRVAVKAFFVLSACSITAFVGLLLWISIFDPFWDAARDQRIDGPYRLMAGDDPAVTDIVYAAGGDSLERVPPNIVNYGFDKRYVVAITRPPLFLKDQGIVTGYGLYSWYYIVRAADGKHVHRAPVHGPFTATRFAAVTRLLKLPSPSRRVR